MNMQTTANSERRGTWFAILSGLFYALLGFFGVSLLKSGFSVFNISFWRFFSAFLFLLIIFLIKGARKAGTMRHSLLVIVNGGIFYGTPGTLFFVSSQYIGTGQAMVIFFVFPVFVMLLNWIFLKQPIKPQYFMSLVMILFGLVMLIDIGEVKLDFFGMTLSLVGAMSYAIYIFFSKTKLASMPALNSSLLASLGCTINCGVLGLIDGSLAWPSFPNQWLYVIGLGIICTALPILFMFEALKYISSDKTSLLSVLEPMFVVVFGIVLLGEVLGVNTVIGIVAILLGAVTVTVTWKVPSIVKFKRS